MSNDKPKIVKMNAPLAIAKWPKLSEPDYGTKEYPKPEGEYSVKLVWDETDPAYEKFRAKMDGYLDAAVAAGQVQFDSLKKPQRDKLGSMKVNPMFTPVYDADENLTGQVEMKLTMKASGVVKKGPREGKKWARSPSLFDALGRPIKGKVDIWGGSELIVAFSFAEGGYFVAGTGACGVKLQLEAVQIVTLRAGGERSADSYGFGKHDGGFDASTVSSKGDDEEDEFAGGGGDADDNHTPSAPAGSDDF